MYKPTYYKKRKRGKRSFPLGLAADVLLFLVLVVMSLRFAADVGADQVFSLTKEPTEPSTCHIDSQPPRISGIQDITIYEGDSVSYLSGVTALDELDPAPELTVDATEVNLSQPGVYLVTYTAADAAGNRTAETATITVLPKEPGYEDLDTINALADDLLAIMLEGTTDTRDQVAAIYRWVRTDIRYGGRSDREDWRQTAYDVIHTGEGDCYGFFAATKLMFERLGIPNIDVQKVRNFDDDSDHFWSLVSIDGGETYYHFDATPRYGDGDDFCLVTDAFLDDYSGKHNGSHNRDTSLYPATPEEAP